MPCRLRLRIDDIHIPLPGAPACSEHASATIPGGHKVGLVGEMAPARRRCSADPGRAASGRRRHQPAARARIGGVAQEAPGTATSVLDTVLAADTERASLLAEAEHATDPARIAEIQTRLADIDAWSAEARAATILKGLGFSTEDQGRPTSDYSGGWRMRVALAGVLFSQPDLLLLDEPTNHLDL